MGGGRLALLDSIILGTRRDEAQPEWGFFSSNNQGCGVEDEVGSDVPLV